MIDQTASFNSQDSDAVPFSTLLGLFLRQNLYSSYCLSNHPYSCYSCIRQQEFKAGGFKFGYLEEASLILASASFKQLLHIFNLELIMCWYEN